MLKSDSRYWSDESFENIDTVVPVIALYVIENKKGATDGLTESSVTFSVVILRSDGV